MGQPRINPLPCLLVVTLVVRELREGRQGSPLRPGRTAFNDRGGSRVLCARHPPRSWRAIVTPVIAAVGGMCESLRRGGGYGQVTYGASGEWPGRRSEAAMHDTPAEAERAGERPGPATLAGRVRRLAETIGDRPAYTFVDYLAGPRGQRATMTWRETDQRARAVAAALRRRVLAGDRAAVLVPQGLDYVAAMLGAFYARVVAVPLFTPDLPGHAGRLAAILADADPA